MTKKAPFVLQIAKLSIFILFFNYYVFSVSRGSLIPHCSIACYAVMAMCFLVDTASLGRGIHFTKEETMWLLYAALSLLTAPLALSTSAAIKGLISYAQRLFMTIMIIYICKREESVRFPISLLTIICLASSLAILPNLASVTRRLKLSTGYNISSNDVGSMLVYGSFAALFFGNRLRISYFLKSVIKAAMILVFCMVLFVAGSRKAFLGTIILFGSLFLFGREKGKKVDGGKALTVLVIGIAAYFIFNKYLWSTMKTTSLYMRVFGRQAEAAQGSDQGRIALYITALKDFISHPIIGLGFANFDVKHLNYTHSTYVEPLACSGAIGFLYLLPYWYMFKKQAALVKDRSRAPADHLWQVRLMCFFVVFMVVAAGIPYMYKDLPSICLALFISSQYLSIRKTSLRGIL